MLGEPELKCSSKKVILPAIMAENFLCGLPELFERGVFRNQKIWPVAGLPYLAICAMADRETRYVLCPMQFFSFVSMCA